MKPITFILLATMVAQTIFAQTVTLDNLFTAPMASGLVASPSGQKIAWVENLNGVRNIYLASPPNYLPEKLTDFGKDDGIEISNIEWTTDEKSLFFIKGNPPQLRATQPHNPSHLLEGAAPMLWKANIEAKKLTKLGLGSGPTVSPDGQKLVFMRAGQIFIKNVADSLAATQLCQVRNGAGQVRWSPDSKKLAFVSSRGTHSFVGVYDFDKKDYRFVSPSIDTDIEPAWSPNGQQIAFLRIRQEYVPQFSFEAVQERTPWSIEVANLETKKSQTIFTADKGIGSYYWNHTGKQQLLWTATNHIVFVWEKTGWQQLYAISATGGAPMPLTKGNFEVDEVLLSLDKKRVIFNSNQDDIDRKHVWTTDLTTNQTTVLTKGKTIEISTQPAANAETLFIVQSDERTPAHVVMYDIKKGIFKNIGNAPATFPQAQLIEPQAVTLTAKDGMKFQAQVFWPKNLKNDKSQPAVIFVHGGSRRQMLLGYHAGSYYGNAYHLNQYLAAKGYVVMAINYRSGIGYGRGFREALNVGPSGNSEFQDVVAAGEWLKAQPAVAASKIGIWGGSYGGYLTAHALAQRSDLFAAGADVHGVHNWNTSIPTFSPDYDVLKNPEKAKLAFESSPLNFLDGWKSPVLFVHGDDDQNVIFAETENMMRALRKKNVDMELLVIPDEIHSFLRQESWLTIYKTIDDFFDRKLLKK